MDTSSALLSPNCNVGKKQPNKSHRVKFKDSLVQLKTDQDDLASDREENSRLPDDADL